MHDMPQRFHLLDTLRGIAALMLVCFHWRHFWITSAGAANLDPLPPSWFPFSKSLYFLYNDGWMGVDLFFTLSGFVFYWKYSEAIFRREVKPREFFILRFSRLYPLHALTLILAAGLQYLVFQKSSSYFTYEYNDAYHFFLNLLFATKWGLEDGYSFNGPIWSVSIEVLMYFLFFNICLWGKIRKRYLLLIVLVGAGLSVPSPYFPLARGLCSFFLGGLVFYIFQWTLEKGKASMFYRIFIWFLPVLCVLALLEIYLNLFLMGLVKIDLNGLIGGSSRINLGFVAFQLRKFAFTLILFPVMIYTLALVNYRKNELGARTSFVGGLSYSSYLLHFPLQLVFVLWLGNHAQLFSRPTVFLSYFFILIFLSLASFKYFEKPVQNAIRRKFL